MLKIVQLVALGAIVALSSVIAFWWFGPRASAARAEEIGIAQQQAAADYLEARIEHDYDAALKVLPAHMKYLDETSRNSFINLIAQFEVVSRREDPPARTLLRCQSAGYDKSEENQPLEVVITLIESDQHYGALEYSDGHSTGDIHVVLVEDTWVVAMHGWNGQAPYLFHDADLDDTELLEALRARLTAENIPQPSPEQLSPEDLGEGLPPGHPPLDEGP